MGFDFAFEIERGIPVPPKSGSISVRGSKYPFAQMRVGDSFAVPLGADKLGKNYLSAVRLRSAASNYRKRSGTEVDFTVRTLHEEDIVRVWRID